MKKIEIGDLLDDKRIVVHEVIENEDGSATVKLDIGADALRTIIQVGFLTILNRGIEEETLNDT